MHLLPIKQALKPFLYMEFDIPGVTEYEINMTITVPVNIDTDTEDYNNRIPK